MKHAFKFCSHLPKNNFKKSKRDRRYKDTVLHRKL